MMLLLLKLPTGALTAFLGLILLHGEFVPGLSALDTSGQILAWALVFGYAQQLFTRLIDTDDQTRVEFTLVELPRRETLLTVVETGFAPLPAGWGPKLAAHTGALAASALPTGASARCACSRFCVRRIPARAQRSHIAIR